MRRLPLLVVAISAIALFSGCAIGFRGPALHITTTTAELRGEVGSNRPDPGEWWFEYGTTRAYGSETPRRAIDFNDERRQRVTEKLEGLQPDTTYHYKLCADDQDPDAGPSCSGAQFFKTAFETVPGQILDVSPDRLLYMDWSGPDPVLKIKNRSTGQVQAIPSVAPLLPGHDGGAQGPSSRLTARSSSRRRITPTTKRCMSGVTASCFCSA